MTVLSDQLPLGQWVEKWNELVFFQSDDKLSAETLSATIDPNIIVKINHDAHDINGLKGGIQYVRQTMKTVLNSNVELLQWSAPDGVGGSVAHRTNFTSVDIASDKKTTKTSLVTTIVKKIDGRRKVSELVEVEIEG